MCDWGHDVDAPRYQYGHMIACMILGVTGNEDVAIGDFMCDWGLGMGLWLLGGNNMAMGVRG